MQTFSPIAPESIPEGTVHVALFAADGSVLFHEEVPSSEQGRHAKRYEYEAELRALAGESTQLHVGPEWPPAGHEIKKGKLAAVPVETP